MSKKVLNICLLGALYGSRQDAKIVAVVLDKVWMLSLRRSEIWTQVLPAAYTIRYDLDFGGLAPIGSLIDVTTTAYSVIVETGEFDLNQHYAKCKLDTVECATSGIVEVIGAAMDYVHEDTCVYIAKPAQLFTDGETNVKYLGATISHYEATSINGTMIFTSRVIATVIKIEADCYWVKDTGPNPLVTRILAEHVQAMDIRVDELAIHQFSLNSILPIGAIIDVADKGLPISLLCTTEHRSNRGLSNDGQVVAVMVEPAHEMGYVYEIAPAPKLAAPSVPRYRFQLVPVNIN